MISCMVLLVLYIFQQSLLFRVTRWYDFSVEYLQFNDVIPFRGMLQRRKGTNMDPTISKHLKNIVRTKIVHTSGFFFLF